MQRRIPTMLMAIGALWLALGALWQPAGAASAVPTPSAEQLRRQWALGQIQAPCAWQYTLGAEAITVAVVDSGVDPTHPDLVSRLRTDGYDFLDDDDDPRDSDGHGTHVAGIIAATLSQSRGVIGLAPGVRILPVRVLDSEGGDDRDIAAGIRFAAEKGAKVINLSLGASLMLAASGASPEITAAIAEAETAGALIVVAAGNDYLPLPNVVAYESPNVVVVAASDREDRRARFSNYGAWVSVVAPGEDILSTMPTYDVFLTSGVPRAERLSNNYAEMSGTSMAAPYVAALAALVFSAAPEATPADVRRIIEANADEAIYEGAPTNVQRLRQLGAGRIDACRTLEALGADLANGPGLPGGPLEIGAGTATPGPSPTPFPTPAVVVERPQMPSLPMPEPTTAVAPPTLPTRTPRPLPRAGEATEAATLFVEALRVGDLEQAQALTAPPELGGTLVIDLAGYIDLSNYLARVGEVSYDLAETAAGEATVRLTYSLAPAEPAGVDLLATGTMAMTRSGGSWYVRSLRLPGLDLSGSLATE